MGGEGVRGDLGSRIHEMKFPPFTNLNANTPREKGIFRASVETSYTDSHAATSHQAPE
jgi:hypothetical protein